MASGQCNEKPLGAAARLNNYILRKSLESLSVCLHDRNRNMTSFPGFDVSHDA